MTRNKSYLTDYEKIDRGFVAFGGNSKGGKIIRKGKIRTSKLDFEDVYFVKELKFNLFSVLQMCDKKNNVLFTDTACVVLSPDFKLTDESHVLLKVPRKDIMYSVNLKNIVPQGGLTCLFAKVTSDESTLWHKRLGHVNFKIINKLVKGNLVRDIENLIDLKVKVIRCDNGTDIKNMVMNQFFEMKGIKREFSVARTPQQNEAEAVNTACYVQNRIPNWIFDIDALTKSMNYKLIIVGNQSNSSASKARVETVPDKDYIRLPLWTLDPLFSSSSKDSLGDGFKPLEEEKKKDVEDPRNEDSEVPSTEEPKVNKKNNANVNNTNNINTISPTENAAGIEDNVVDENIVYRCADDPNMPGLEDISIFEDSNKDVFGVEVDLNNMESTFHVSPIPITRIHKDHPLEQVIRDLHSAPQTMRMNKLDERGIVIRNKAILMAQGHTQEEGIDYDEVFVPVARIEVIMLFLAYALFKDFVVYQMDSKSAFIYGKIEEQVYFCQPLGFKDLDFPDKLYKVEKALYRLHQAPRDGLRPCARRLSKNGDEHLDTIPEKESDKFIKFSVENLVSSPSESEDEHECDVPVCDDFTTFSNLLFDADDDFSSNPYHFNVESDLIESLHNYDSSIISSSSKIDFLLDEFAGELILLKSIPPGIDEANWDMLILEELLSNDSLSISENESFHFDILSSPPPHAKPPDDDSRILTVKMVGDISEQYVPTPRILPTKPTLASNQEKSPHLLSHRGLKAFQLSFECPMMIYG
nr:ribonuclease H-like domain-containing protein [Tanacetum cinerariifolium]